MKILFIAPRLHTNQYAWVDALLKNNHEVRFWSWKKEKENIFAPIKTESIEWSFLSKIIPRLWKPRKYWFAVDSNMSFPKIRLLYKKLKKYNPDIVVARDPHAYLFSFVSLVMARFMGSQILIYTQHPLYREKKMFLRFLINIFINIFKAKWITPVLGDKDRYLKKIHEKSFYVPFSANISIGVNLKLTNNKLGLINIISVGVLNRSRKNNLLLLQALKKVENEFNFYLTMVGKLSNEKDFVYQNLLKYVAENNMQNVVSFKNNLNHNEMIEEYKKNDLFILPSKDEPAAYSLLEAMAFGLPVICSDTNGTQWYLEKGKNGYIFKSDNLDDLVEKIKLALKDKNKLKKMGEHSLKLAKENHSPEVFYRKFMQAVKS